MTMAGEAEAKEASNKGPSPASIVQVVLRPPHLASPLLPLPPWMHGSLGRSVGRQKLTRRCMASDQRHTTTIVTFAHVQDAESVEEVLSVAALLPLLGEETLHWQKQAHHREKMQSV